MREFLPFDTVGLRAQTGFVYRMMRGIVLQDNATKTDEYRQHTDVQQMDRREPQGLFRAHQFSQGLFQFRVQLRRSDRARPAWVYALLVQRRLDASHHIRV